MIGFNAAFNLIAGYCAAYRASDGRQFATPTAAYLVTQQATYDCSACCSYSAALAARINFVDCINHAAIRANSRAC
jgi:hypothetical protein